MTVSVRVVANVAVTVFPASIVTVQVRVLGVGMQFADHPTRTEPVPGLAVSVTTVSIGNAFEHVDPHEMPVGLEDTLPDPFETEARDTVSV